MCRVTDNLGLARHIANKFVRGVPEPFEDLFQAGCEGLVKADRDYKEGDVPFGAYAGSRIQWEIIVHLKKTYRISEKNHIKDIASMISKRKMHDSTAEEIHAVIKRPIPDIERALNFLKAEILSLDYKIKQDTDNSEDYYNLMPYEQGFDTDLLMENMMQLIIPSHREPLRMYIAGMQYPEIASRLGSNVKSVKNKVFTARKLLKANKELIC